MSAVTAMPAHSDPLAQRPSGDVWTDRIDDSRNLVPRNARILEAGPGSLLGKRVAVADAAGLDFDAHRTRAGPRDFALDEFQGAIRADDLYDAHRRR